VLGRTRLGEHPHAWGRGNNRNHPSMARMPSVSTMTVAVNQLASTSIQITSVLSLPDAAALPPGTVGVLNSAVKVAGFYVKAHLEVGTVWHFRGTSPANSIVAANIL
jgi:hypothetical protein